MKKQALLGALALTAVLLFSACNDQPPAPPAPEDTTVPVTTEAPTEAPIDPLPPSAKAMSSGLPTAWMLTKANPRRRICLSFSQIKPICRI